MATKTGAKAPAPERPLQRKRPAYPAGFSSWSTARQLEWTKLMVTRPEAQALRRLMAVINEVRMEPVILASPEHYRLAWLICELLAESVPGDSLEAMLGPLWALKARSVGSSGGAAGRAWKEAQKASNEALVRAEYKRLEQRQRGRNATAAIAARLLKKRKPPVRLSDNTIRSLVKAIEAKEREK